MIPFTGHDGLLRGMTKDAVETLDETITGGVSANMNSTLSLKCHTVNCCFIRMGYIISIL